MTSMIEWHVLSVDPDDLPGEEDPVIATLENPVSGERFVWNDVYLKNLDDDGYMFCTKALNDFGMPEETAVWYPVRAWAYPPAPFEYY